MPSFFDGIFAVAGVAAAAGPVIIHLLNRRRFRTVQWAAMDFLREAMRRSRRILQIRDLLLLLLRTACVLLFGLAMARPYFSGSGTVAGLGQPVHAVLVVDNSLSMGFQRLDGMLLDEARAKVREFVERLPQGSQITVLPLCGTPGQFSFEPYRTKEDALEALEAIKVVDRQGSAAQALDLARQACHLVPKPEAKRIVFIGDQQSINWPSDSLAPQLAELPDLQIVQIADGGAENAWVADLRLQDGIADVETSTVFLATIRYQGREPRHDVQVTLTVDGVPVASQSIDLEPGQSREVTFPYRFDVAAEPGRETLSTASVSIPTDRLAEDDERALVVPVVAALPVVFVDQYGKDEDPVQNRYGETFRLRRLLAPVTTHGDYSRQLIQVRHVKIDELNQQNLQDARLVVIAGVESPGAVVPLLREYVEQGGNLVIAAGAEFDPVAWQNAGWLDGRGILPAPLQPEFVGARPDEAPNHLQPFFLDVTTLSNDWFQIDRASDEELADLYRLPIFFKAVAVDLGDEAIAKALRDETERIAKSRLPPKASPATADQPAAARPAANSDVAPKPAWLLWANHPTSNDALLPPAELAERTRPHAMAMFNNRLPFLVQRKLGPGQIVFVASGVQSDWNTLTTTNAVLVFDRIFRSLLQDTLPVRNFTTVQNAVIPVEPQDRGLRFTLTRPKRPEEPLTIGALAADLYGLTVSNMSERGIYRVAAYRQGPSAGPEAESKVWEIPFAADGPQRESELQSLSQATLAERAGGGNYRWVARTESIQLEGSQVSGQNLWKTLMSGALACLLLELVVLSRPKWGGRRRRMSFTAWIARLFGYHNVEAIDEISPSLAAPWAHDHPLLVALACLACLGLALAFYARLQPRRRPLARIGLSLCRGAIICLLLLFLAEPTLVFKLTSHPRPLVWLLFDGTDSMAIQDDLPDSDRRKLNEAVGLRDDARRSDEPLKRSRIEYVQSLLARKDENLLGRLEEKFRLKAFRFDRPDGATTLKLAQVEGNPAEPATLDAELSTRGQVTAIGAALADLAQRNATTNLAGVVVFSDFDQNAGPAALASAQQLGAPIYAVGVGPTAAVDLAVDLQAPLLMKKDERSNLVVTIRQNGFDGRTVPLRVTARRLGATSDATPIITVTQQNVLLSAPSVPVDVGYTPTETGRFLLTAEVEPLEGEVIQQNNRSQREVSIRDDFLRLMFVEYQPTWEWRFIKEVFHRDQLVGMRGFRTFLRSADPKVRQTNELFLSTMTPPRSDFFANDVIFLGDMPAPTLSTRFCEMTKEFVSTFGGGLVIVSGPGFGPGQLAATPLADLLPVVVDGDARLRDDRPFTPHLTFFASQVDFMQLGNTTAENQKGWNNLGQLPWYQPVSRVHPLATVLLEHPTDTCIDGKVHQPLIAVRRYGRGEVVYLAFDETWRLRRKYGETYYRQFWGQMIHRLGLSHALGSQKRFVVRTDRQQYQSNDTVLLTVEAYDENFEPMVAEKLPDHKIWGELLLPGHAGGPTPSTVNPLPADSDNRQPLPIPQLRPGVFEAQIQVFAAGEHRVKVKDPITSETVEVRFQVTSLSAERRSAVRNTAIQEQLAAATGGKSYDLVSVAHLPDEIRSVVRTESAIEVFPLWNTWPCFTLVIVLMLGEWLLRKLVNLA